MALSQSALSELLDAVRAGGSEERTADNGTISQVDSEKNLLLAS